MDGTDASKWVSDNPSIGYAAENEKQQLYRTWVEAFRIA